MEDWPAYEAVTIPGSGVMDQITELAVHTSARIGVQVRPCKIRRSRDNSPGVCPLQTGARILLYPAWCPSARLAIRGLVSNTYCACSNQLLTDSCVLRLRLSTS